MLRSGTLPTFHLIEKYVRPGRLARFIYAGTPESYASTVSRFGWPVPTDESVPLCVDDVYSIVRYHNVFGPRMGDKHVIPDFLNRLRDGVAELRGHRETRTFMYVADAVAAAVMIGAAGSAVGQIVSLGGDEELTILELATRIMELLGPAPETIDLKPAPAGSVGRRAPNIEKLRESVGFQWTLVGAAGDHPVPRAGTPCSWSTTLPAARPYARLARSCPISTDEHHALLKHPAVATHVRSMWPTT